MKKGFTLIELLAVIVILAIIALIAVPIVLEVITKTKEEAIIRSAENYLKAVELSITNSSINKSIKKINGTYEIIDGGKRVQKGDEPLIEVDYDGEGLESGTVLVKDGKIKRVKNAKIGNLVYVKSFRGNTMLFNETPEDVTLLTGQNFNAAIKTLVNGGTAVTYATEDTTVKTIEFLSYGKLPDGYTLKELESLESVNVSVGNDNKILAYFDGVENVFIYSEGLINFNLSSNSLFQKFQNVESIKFNEIDTSKVKQMFQMFQNCSNLTNLDLSNFDTSKATNIYNMFYNCTSLTKLDLSDFDTTNVSGITGMFCNCSSLISLNISNFNTSLVTKMNSMFSGCTKLKKLDLSSFDTSIVISMSGLFSKCTSLTKLDLSNFNTSKVTDMSYMFQNCSNLTNLDLSNFDTDLVTIMTGMFKSTTKLQSLNISSFQFNDSVSTDNMFSGSKTGMNIIVGGESQKIKIGSLHPTANITIK